MINNDIKLQKINPVETTNVRQDAPKTSAAAQTDGIVISQHLDKLITFLGEEPEVALDAERVLAVKNRIETNQYRVDIDALSDKLIHHLVDGI